MKHESIALHIGPMRHNRAQQAAVVSESNEGKNLTPTPKTRAKCKIAPEWDKLPEWLPLKDAALKAALMSENSFRTWAKAQRIRTRSFGKCKRYHRDDIRGFKP